MRDLNISFEETAAIQQYQDERLRELIAYVAERSPYYQRLFSHHGITPDSIMTSSDLALLPPTTKEDLQQHNWDFLCVEKSEIAEYMSTSGTLGKPVTVALTQHDLDRLALNESLSFQTAGCSGEDTFQLMLTLDRQFMAGIAYYQGIQKLGGSVIRVGPGLPMMQWDTIQRLQPTVLVAVPSFIITLIQYVNEQGYDLNETSVKRIICIGESIRTAEGDLNTIGQTIQKHWKVSLHSTYASTEMQTAFTECSAGNGGHLSPGLLIVELLDDQNNPVNAGELGEVTITTLGVEGMPLLRYKTGDIARQQITPCTCGRNSVRLGAIAGRKKQMLKVKGTTLFPPAIVDVIQQVSGVKEYLVEASTSALGLDEITVYIQSSGDEYNMLSNLEKAFQSHLRVKPQIHLLSAEKMQQMLNRSSGRKIQRFVDRRV
jgi:phenylacetate-CoA ligase